jgi:DNA-binding transcriptional LysR family regulator
MSPALSTNDIEAELQALLAGQAIGQLANFAAASDVRTGQLVPVLHEHMSADMGFHIYYGSRAAQPKRVRAFLDLAIARLHDSPNYVLSSKEVATAQQKWARKPRE